jgi:hypothetical protein
MIVLRLLGRLDKDLAPARVSPTSDLIRPGSPERNDPGHTNLDGFLENAFEGGVLDQSLAQDDLNLRSRHKTLVDYSDICLVPRAIDHLTGPDSTSSVEQLDALTRHGSRNPQMLVLIARYTNDFVAGLERGQVYGF